MPHLQHLIRFDCCAISCRFGQLVTEMNNSLWGSCGAHEESSGGAKEVTEAAVFG